MPDAGVLTGTTIAIGQTVVAYQFFLPRFIEVRQASPDDGSMRADVMMGQIAAGGVALAIGGLLSWMMKSPLPVFVALMIAGITATFYEWAFATGGSRE